MKKTFVTGLIAVTVSAFMSIPALAGTWQTGAFPNQHLWWYDNGNGSYAANGWYWIDGNLDGISECYYFDASGWLLVSAITPDGYTVDSNGAWTVNGIVQTKTATSNASGNTDIDTASYAYQVFELVNQEREKEGKEPLDWDDELASCAQIRAEEIAQVFSHTRPNDTSCFTILDENGIDYSYAGENIAFGQISPQDVMNSWMNSSGHRANILNSSFDSIGVGCYKDNGTLRWVQLFIS